MSAHEGSNLKLRDVMQVVSLAVANITVVFVVSSILYEYFYFWMLDWDMMRLLSATDYLKLLVYWLPTTLVAASFGWFINYTDTTARFRAVQKYGESGLAAWRTPDKWMQRLQYFLITVSAIALPFISLKNFHFLQLPMYIIAGYVITMLIVRDLLPLTVRPQDSIFYYASIMFMFITALFSGANAAVRDIGRQSPIHVIETSTGQFSVVLMRSIDKGIIYHYQNDSRVTFTPWDKITFIKSDNINISDRKIHDWFLSLFR